jgi:8-oxo-dGTP pyrophosphatase MutT (NUDIX family)
MTTAVGTIFYAANTKRCLFLLRSGAKFSETWGMVGGKIEANETLIDALHREIQEEISFIPNIDKYIPLENFTSVDGDFKYYTYLCVVAEEFIPSLNSEHQGFCWCDITKYPKPLHPGFFNCLSLKVVQKKLQTIRFTF